MNYAVQFAPEALDQLDAVISRAGSPLTAVRYVDAIVAYCVSLTKFPQRGVRRDDLMPTKGAQKGPEEISDILDIFPLAPFLVLSQYAPV